MAINTEHVSSDAAVMGGAPCLRGHRLTMAQVLVGVTDVGGMEAFCDDYGLRVQDVAAAVRELAWCLGQLGDR